MKERWSHTTKVVSYIIVDLVDWNTNQRKFRTQEALTEWAKRLCETYDVSGDEFKTAWQHLQDMDYLTVKVSNNGAVVITIDSPVKDEPVKTDGLLLNL
jgi:hypothetical protein